MLTPGSRVAEVYGASEISERHRHRYEVNTNYTKHLAEHGLVVSGWSPDGKLPEIMEIPEPSLVHRRAIPPGTEIAPLRSASAVPFVHRRGGEAEQVGLRVNMRHRHLSSPASERRVATRAR